MTHTTVTRAAMAVTGGLTALTVAFGCLANRQPPAAPVAAPAETTTPHPGEPLFDAYCTGCHTIDEAVIFVRRIPDAQAARRELSTLLSSHGDTSAGQDALIVDYVMDRR